MRWLSTNLPYTNCNAFTSKQIKLITWFLDRLLFRKGTYIFKIFCITKFQIFPQKPRKNYFCNPLFTCLTWLTPSSRTPTWQTDAARTRKSLNSAFSTDQGTSWITRIRLVRHCSCFSPFPFLAPGSARSAPSPVPASIFVLFSLLLILFFFLHVLMSYLAIFWNILVVTSTSPWPISCSCTFPCSCSCSSSSSCSCAMSTPTIVTPSRPGVQRPPAPSQAGVRAGGVGEEPGGCHWGWTTLLYTVFKTNSHLEKNKL